MLVLPQVCVANSIKTGQNIQTQLELCSSMYLTYCAEVVQSILLFGITSHWHRWPGDSKSAPEDLRIVNIRPLVPEQEEASFYQLTQLSHIKQASPECSGQCCFEESMLSKLKIKMCLSTMLTRQAGKFIIMLLTKALAGFVVTMHKMHVH